MVSTSKKDARKAQKGKSKVVESAKPKSALKKPVVEVEEDEEWESEVDSADEEDEDEDNGGVSEAGMKRLMELVGEEDLDDFERAQLALDDEEDDEDEDEDEEDEDEEDEEDEDEEVGELSGESSDEEEEEDVDMGEQPSDDQIIIADADPDTIAIDDLASDVSLDEDAVPMRKVTANNKPAMRLLTESLKVTNMPFPETLILTSKATVDVDPSDDLNRETAFYKIALDQVANVRKLCSKHDIPFSRPNDYYAEMVKSDDHMERIRTKLVEESQGIKKSEAARKQRELKKFGKQIQVEKLKQREQDKKGFQDKIQGLKRKRKEGMDLGEDGDEFGIAVEDGDDRPQRGGSNARGGRGGKSKMPRHARDAKFSLGGGARRSKQNTKESTTDFAGWGGDSKKGGRGGGKSGGGQRGGKNRPGKSRRSGGRR